MRLSGQLANRESLTDVERDQMFALMTDYYSNMRRWQFDADLDEKQWVIVVTDPHSGCIRGFSTQTLLDATVNGRPVRALFSGDTIVHQQYWGRNPLAQLWGRLALSLIDETADQQELYWFLITKGYKTYRFLPVFFHEFFPRFDAPTPSCYAKVIDAFGVLKFPKQYDDLNGIVPTADCGCRLRPHVAAIDSQRLRDPHVEFFVQRNPGHARGDELCCLAPLTRDNFTQAAYRVIGKTPAPLTVS